MKKIIIILFCVCFNLSSQNSEKNDSINNYQILNEIKLRAINGGKKTPISFTNFSKNQIQKVNLGQDLPYIISLTPSVISSSDAGAGIGYTYMTIRGSDASRINVTINGIPLNDSESQGVWWVNMPDFSSSVNNIQIQRGVGTSTNGGSAFGASVNLNTDIINKERYSGTNISFGSYNSLKKNFQFGSGIINNKWSFDGRISNISSNGYIDRASSNLESAYFSTGYYEKNESLKAIFFTGHERTYQAWNGVPKSYLDSSPTFNAYNYENEVDDYKQSHFQLHYNKIFNRKSIINIATHYTLGSGYYEQYKGDKYNEILNFGMQETLSEYDLFNDTIDLANLVRRKWLDNDFYGVVFSAHHSIRNIDFILGGSINEYIGNHFGQVIWSDAFPYIDHEYYRNEATKKDRNIYLKAEYAVSDKLNLFGDIQTRKIKYDFEGLNENGVTTNQTINHDFFNPKMGFFYNLNNYIALYASYAVGNKEPNRNDYIESSPSSRPKHETLYDTELGFKYNYNNVFIGLNCYYMDYKNQLINTGQINDVGYSVHTNIKDSYRKGIELMYDINITKNIKWNGNITLSDNKIEKHSEFVDNWDTWMQQEVDYENTNIAFSPNIISKSKISYKIGKLEGAWIFKHIGKQYIDNTQSEERMLESYSLNNILFSYELQHVEIKKASISLQVNNIFNNSYVNRAWVYRFNSNDNQLGYDPYINADSDGYNMIGYYPQATRNYLVGLSLYL